MTLTWKAGIGQIGATSATQYTRTTSIELVAGDLIVCAFALLYNGGGTYFSIPTEGWTKHFEVSPTYPGFENDRISLMFATRLVTEAESGSRTIIQINSSAGSRPVSQK